MSPSCSSLHLPSSCVDSDAFLCKTSVFLTEEKKTKKKRRIYCCRFFSLHVSLSEVRAFYSKENIFYILLTVDFFVVNIFCIFIYKSHKENSNVQLYTLNLQLENKKTTNKVNSVVSPCCLLFLCPSRGGGGRGGSGGRMHPTSLG